MTYNAQGIGKSGARKRLVDHVIRQVEAWMDGKESAYCMQELRIIVEQYKKENSK